MSELESTIRECCRICRHDRTRLLDIVRAAQQRLGGIGPAALDALAAELGLPRGEIEGVVSFYDFLSSTPQGGLVIRVCTDVVDGLRGGDDVLRAFAAELGVAPGGTTSDGRITLRTTACIGMCDQAPAALVNEVVLTELTADRARQVVRELRAHGEPRRLVAGLGDGHNAHPLVRSMVRNHIRRAGPVLLAPVEAEAGLRRAVTVSPEEVIRMITAAGLRGRGGAGFSTGRKWSLARAMTSGEKWVIGNADEGEPGTFKDRVLLTERADLIVEGLTIAAYAVGARRGLLYLRGEYAYLRAYLDDVLRQRRAARLLGPAILGRAGFDFDVRIQLGAGAYVCGEETALISSCEGQAGDPRDRPPFPAQHGFRGGPTVVNNPETLCCAARIVAQGPDWFAGFGTRGGSGTKLFSLSGDCARPGVYEYPFGVSLRTVLEESGAPDAQAVQVGGPSGQLVGAAQFARRLDYDDLATGGALVVFNATRDVLRVALGYLDFFIHESCGCCTPCRVGNVLLRRKLAEILAGRGERGDLEYLRELAGTIQATSRCGLGQTAPNPVLSTLAHFAPAYERYLGPPRRGVLRPSFDLRAALAETGGEGKEALCPTR